MADLFSDVAPPVKINADASVKKWASASPEESLAMDAFDVRPHAAQMNINEIDSELARKDITAANKVSLMDIRKQMMERGGSVPPSLFDDVSPPSPRANGDLFAGIAPPSKPMADPSNWDYLKNKLSNDWEDVKNLPSKLFTTEGAKGQVSSLAKLADVGLSIPSMITAYAAPIPKLIAESMGPGRQYALENYKEEKDKVLAGTSIDQALQRTGLAREQENPLVSAIGHGTVDPIKKVVGKFIPEGSLGHDIVSDAITFAAPVAGYHGAKAFAGREPLRSPTLRPTEGAKVPVQGDLFADIAPPLEGPFKPGSELKPAQANYALPPKLNDAIAKARFELDKPEWERTQKSFADMQNEVATPKMLQKEQGMFDFGPEVNPKAEPNAQVALNPRQGEILSKDIVAGNGMEYTLNYHTTDGVVEVLDAHGNVVGSATNPMPLGKPAKVSQVDVEPYHQRAGLSSAVHDMLEEVHKGGLDKSDITSPEGKAFWENRSAIGSSKYQELSPTRILSSEEATATPNRTGKTGSEPVAPTDAAGEGSMAEFEALMRGETPQEGAPQYTKQQELHINPMDSLISEAKRLSEPKAPRPPKAEPIPETPKAPTTGEQASFAEAEPSFSKDIDQTMSILDTAKKDIYPEGTPSKAKFEEQSSLPLVMSPEEMMTTFGITPETIKGLESYHTGLDSPIHKRRDFWVNNPILRSALDSIKELADRSKRSILESLDTHSVDSFFKERGKLSRNEEIEYAYAKSRADETSSPAMRDEGRTHHTFEEWKAQGVSDNVARALVEGDKALEIGRKLVNEVERNSGRAEIPTISNYMPHQHAYPFRVTITDLHSGEKQIRSFPTRAEAKAAAESVHRDIGKSSAVDYERVDSSAANMLDSLADDKSVRDQFKGQKPSSFAKMVDNILAKRDAAFLGVTKNREGRGDYTGSHLFEPTSNPVLLERYSKDAKFITDLPEKYLNDAIRYSTKAKANAYMEALRTAGKEHGVSHTGAWKQVMDTLEKHAEAYTNPVFDTSKRSVPEKVLDVVSAYSDKSVIPGHVKVPALAPQAMLEVVRGFAKIAMASKISPYANMALLPVQYLQPFLSPINTVGGSLRLIAKNAPEMPSMASKAIAAGKTPIDVVTASIKGMRDTVLHQANERFPNNLVRENAQKAIDWAYKGGHLASFLEHEHLDIKQKTFRNVTGQQVSEHAEYSPRTVAFLSQYYTAKNLGFTEGAARRAAVHGMNEIMGDYSKESKPRTLRGLDPLSGSVISQLSTFLLNTTSQLHTLGTNTGVKSRVMTGVVLPLIAYLGASYIATGWKGLPGVQDYDNAVRSLNDKFNMSLPTSYELKIRSHDVFGDYSNKAYYGALSELTGSDVAKSGRAGSMFSYGGFAPSMLGNVVSSVYQEGKNLAHKAGVSEAPSDKALYESRKAITPPNFQYLVDDAYAKQKPNGNTILRGGIVRDKNAPSRLVVPFEPLGEKKQRDEMGNITYRKALQLKQSKTQIDLIKDKADRGEDFTSNVKKLVELNPDISKDPNALEDMIKGDQIKRRLNLVEREMYDAIQGESLNKLQNAKHADMVKRLSER